MTSASFFADKSLVEGFTNRKQQSLQMLSSCCLLLATCSFTWYDNVLMLFYPPGVSFRCWPKWWRLELHVRPNTLCAVLQCCARTGTNSSMTSLRWVTTELRIFQVSAEGVERRGAAAVNFKHPWVGPVFSRGGREASFSAEPRPECSGLESGHRSCSNPVVL